MGGGVGIGGGIAGAEESGEDHPGPSSMLGESFRQLLTDTPRRHARGRMRDVPIFPVSEKGIVTNRVPPIWKSSRWRLRYATTHSPPPHLSNVPFTDDPGARRASQGALGAGVVAGLPTKQRSATAAGLVGQRAGELSEGTESHVDEARGNSGGGGGEASGQGTGGAVGENDYSHILKIKAAQALFRMSLEPEGEVRSPVHSRNSIQDLGVAGTMMLNVILISYSIKRNILQNKSRRLSGRRVFRYVKHRSTCDSSDEREFPHPSNHLELCVHVSNSILACGTLTSQELSTSFGLS